VVTRLSEDALLDSARTMTAQMKLLEDASKPPVEAEPLAAALEGVVRRGLLPLEEAQEQAAKDSKKIRRRLGV
jgi:hypothetical protein